MLFNDELMMKLIANAVCGASLDKELVRELDEEELEGLYKRSSSHDMAGIVSEALSSNQMLGGGYNVCKKFEQQTLAAFYRHEQTVFAFEELCGALEKWGIDFIPLKGSVIRDYYPKGYMRTSCDIDVLIHKEDIERASDLLERELGYTDRHLGSHDVSFFTSGRVHIELHYDLIEDDRANACRDILAEVWEYAYKKEGYSFWYELSDDMFYFYHIAHMAKHIEIGGCGIRTFLDLWILNNKVEHDDNARKALLERGRLLQFATVANDLSLAWFGSGEHNELTLWLEDFILGGGTYGSREKRVQVLRSKKGGKFGYAMSKIFLSYDVIKYQYPILMKHKWLWLYANVRRWFKLVFGGSAKRSIRELKMNNDLSDDKANETESYLKKIGL